MTESLPNGPEPLLSIVTVVKNAKETIFETLESVPESPEIEFIVIDGNSTDGTRQLLESKSDLIDVLVSEEDDGLYYAMNKSIQLAHGKFILFLNADDYLSRDGFLKALEVLRKHQDNSNFILVGDIQIVGSENILHVPISDLAKRMVPHPGTFMALQLVKSLSGFNTTFRVAADYDLLLRAKKSGADMRQLKEVITFHRKGGYSSTHTRRSINETLVIQISHSKANMPYSFGLFLKSIVRLWWDA